MVGNEGIVGITLFMGGETMPNQAVVQSPGHAYRLNVQLLKQEFNRAGALQHLLLRHTLALLSQMVQTAVCNRHHSVDQQLCRWLLLSLDRLPSNDLRMTQELIANMLGVRRESVTEAAGKLQGAGLIHYNRGRITVLDRPGLEARDANVLRLSDRSSAAFSRMWPCSDPFPTHVVELAWTTTSFVCRSEVQSWNNGPQAHNNQINAYRIA